MALAGMNTCSWTPSPSASPAANPVTMPNRFPIQGCLFFSRHEDNRTFSPRLPCSTATSGDGDPKHAPCPWDPIELSIGARRLGRPPPLLRDTVSSTASGSQGNLRTADWIREVAGPRATPGTGSPTGHAANGVSITPILPDGRRTVCLLRNPGCHRNGGAAGHPPDRPRQSWVLASGAWSILRIAQSRDRFARAEPSGLGRCTVQIELLQKGPLTLPVQLPMRTAWESMMPLPPLDLPGEGAVRGIDDGLHSATIARLVTLLDNPLAKSRRERESHGTELSERLLCSLRLVPVLCWTLCRFSHIGVRVSFLATTYTTSRTSRCPSHGVNPGQRCPCKCVLCPE